ncbi:MAG: hypothetical protein P9X24_08300 [Candidatus Hatepunaea meridiana]|nr:hypothetical protein [Candidatus Hatepunaea meridiana]
MPFLTEHPRPPGFMKLYLSPSRVSIRPEEGAATFGRIDILVCHLRNADIKKCCQSSRLTVKSRMCRAG